VTHSMWAAATYARRLVVLVDGAILLDGPTRGVMADPRLTSARLVPPGVVRLSRALGSPALTAAEFRGRVAPPP
jgi:energy-coupling factor transporter ATP-binding protein EcfA2